MNRRVTVTFELAVTDQGKRSMGDFRRQCYALMGRSYLLREEGPSVGEERRLDNQLHLIEAK